MRQIPESSVHSVQGIADYINSRFSTQNDKSRSIFIWIAKNIQYDIGNMFLMNTYLNQTEVANKTLKTKKEFALTMQYCLTKLPVRSGLNRI